MTENVTDLAEVRRRRRRILGPEPTEMPKTLFVIEDWTELGIEWIGAPTIGDMPPDFPPIDGDLVGIYELVGVRRLSVKMELQEDK